MLRTIVATCCIVSVSQTLRADEICVACVSPAATYRCSFEQSTRDHRLPLEDVAQAHICENVLKQAGAHADCKIVSGPEPCNGAPRTVTVDDYQRLVASDGHSTYQQGFLEKAQRCLTSFFGDC
jgi:hypothetical protein